MSKRPNIIVFMPDQLRADSIGTFGESIVRTPNFDKLASDGIAFTNCFVQHPVCTPSRCSFMTGWYPHVRGHRTLDYLLREDEPNLLKYLKDAGYWVEWHGKNDLLNRESFEHSISHRGKLNSDKGSTWIPNPWDKDDRMRHSFYYGKREKEDIYDHDYAVMENSIDFIKNRAEKTQPFFLYMPLMYPHPPYNVEEPFFSMYDRDLVRQPAKADYNTKPAFMKELAKLNNISVLSDEEKKEIIATYYGMVSRIDFMFGEFLNTLKEEGLYEDTAIFVFSDHGDYTCDYDLVEKWWTGLTDNLVRVPFILKYPNQKRKNIKSDNLIELIDFFPTVMEIAGIENYHQQFGKSLIRLCDGETNTHREYAFAESGHGLNEYHCMEDEFPEEHIYYPKTHLPRDNYEYLHKAVMIRSKEWKYIKHLTDKPELYNMNEDPKEEHNLAEKKEYTEIIKEMETQLLQWYMETADYVPFAKDKRDLEGY